MCVYKVLCILLTKNNTSTMFAMPMVTPCSRL